MNFKPGDFFFGIVEFLAYLVPGAILLMTLPEMVFDKTPALFALPDTNTSTFHWIMFTLMSYILGHFIHNIGALIFNPVYEGIYFKRKKKQHAGFVAAAEENIKRIIPEHDDPVRVADGFIRFHQASLITELDKHVANSKLFRGLALLFMVLLFYPGNVWWQNIILIVMAFLSFSRFANQRWRRQLLTYELFLIITSGKKIG